MSECAICLSAISLFATVARTSCCEPQYHDECLLRWSSMSNLCPTCRLRFHLVIVFNKETPTTRYTIPVKDKLLPVELEIPDEFIVPAHVVPGHIPTCCLCADPGASIVCSSCDAMYHHDCIGDGEYLHCPMCDEEIEGITRTRGASTRSRLTLRLTLQLTLQLNSRPLNSRPLNSRPLNSRLNPQRLTLRLNPQRLTSLPLTSRQIENSVGTSSSTSRGVRSIRTTTMNSSSSRSSNNSGGNLVIHNDHDELDDDFLYAPRPQSNVVNGGVILRREQRAIQLLSPDERRSWEAFERARTGAEDETSTAKVSPVKRRRRKKITPTAREEPKEVEGGRISALIGQLKRGRERNDDRSGNERRNNESDVNVKPEDLLKRPVSKESEKTFKSREPIIKLEPANTSSFSDPMSMGPSSSKITSIPSGSPSSPQSPVFSPPLHPQSPSLSPALSPQGKLSLSLEQKCAVQRIVRDRLKPLYNNTLRTEQDFIRVNKHILRTVYGTLVARCVRDGGNSEMLAVMRVNKDMVVAVVESELERMGTGKIEENREVRQEVGEELMLKNSAEG